MVEAGADFKGADPLSGADKGRLLVPGLHKSALDLAVGGHRLTRVALQYEP